MLSPNYAMVVVYTSKSKLFLVGRIIGMLGLQVLLQAECTTIEVFASVGR